MDEVDKLGVCRTRGSIAVTFIHVACRFGVSEQVWSLFVANELRPTGDQLKSLIFHR